MRPAGVENPEEEIDELRKRIERDRLVIQMPELPPGAGGPPCIWCNAPTRRTGACFTCIACGATTSC